MAAVRFLSACSSLTQRSTLLVRGTPYARCSFSTTSIMSAQENIKYEVKDGVAVLTFDTPGSKVNTLNKAVMAEFEQLLQRFEGDGTAKSAVLCSGKPECFIAGADISMLQACKSSDEVAELSKSSHKMLQKIEDSKKPIVAAIMGPCLGGGLEVSMACHSRIAVEDSKTNLGTPEVLLGILPGAGGTQRLPSLVSVPNALDMVLTGKNIKAAKAKKMGLVDRTVKPLGPGLKHANDMTRDYLEKVAIEYARGLGNGSIKLSPRNKGMQEKIMDFALQYDFVKDKVIEKARSAVMKQTQGCYPAPLKILDVMKVGLKNGFKSKEGYAAEAEGFGQLAMTNESNALMGLFHGQTACKKNNIGKPKKKAENVAVLGAGLMGAGIAHVSVQNGMKVILKDMAASGLVRGQQQIEKGLQTAVKKKKMTSFEKDQLMSNLQPQLDYTHFKEVDMVIEAVFEDINVKHKVVKEVEQHISDNCIFASNTSALPITDIAKASKRPENVVGIHYFSPVDKMQLIEVISTEKTSQDTLASAVDISLRQGKTVIVVKDSPGFYTTRALCGLFTEAFQLFREGMQPKQMDKFTKSMGFPVGSAMLFDEVGIDVGAHIAEFLGKQFGSRMGDTEAMTEILKKMVANGILGRKSGKGVYLYQSGSKDRPENQAALDIFKDYYMEPKMPLNYENTRMRLLGRFTNEAVMCLQEGIIRNPIEGDVGLVFGLGFPPFLGGPFRWVDHFGADNLVSELRKIQDAGYGNVFEPCDMLLDYAKDSSKKFHSV